MKRIFLISLLILSLAGYAYSNVVIGGGHLGSACTTPDNGDELDEGFLGAGYEDGACGAAPCWAETIGGGDTVDEDHTLTGTPPSSGANSCTEGLLVSTSEDNSHAQWDRGSAIETTTSDVDLSVELYIDSAVVDNYANFKIIDFYDASSPGVLKIYNNNGTYQLYIDATVDSDNVTIAEDTWYTIFIHYDTTAASSYWTLDGGAQKSFTRTDNDCRYIRLGGFGTPGSGESIVIEFGYVYANTP